MIFWNWTIPWHCFSYARTWKRANGGQRDSKTSRQVLYRTCKYVCNYTYKVLITVYCCRSYKAVTQKAGASRKGGMAWSTRFVDFYKPVIADSTAVSRWFSVYIVLFSRYLVLTFPSNASFPPSLLPFLPISTPSSNWLQIQEDVSFFFVCVCGQLWYVSGYRTHISSFAVFLKRLRSCLL